MNVRDLLGSGHIRSACLPFIRHEITKSNRGLPVQLAKQLLHGLVQFGFPVLGQCDLRFGLACSFVNGIIIAYQRGKG